MVDYNVTCPDFRYCQVRHTYASPCEIWNCNACWWHHSNCTPTPEPASEHCPYIYKCSNLPRPHNHVTTTVVTTVTVLSVLTLVGTYIYKRYRRAQQEQARIPDAEQQEEEENERVPLLQRCRALVAGSLGPSEDGNPDTGGLFDRFRAVIFGSRAEVASPEVPRAVGDYEDEEPSAPPPPPDREDQHLAPPPPYEEVDRNPNPRPIIRSGGSLANENFTGSQAQRASGPPGSLPHSVEMREISSSPRPHPSAPRLEEIPLSLSQSLR